MYDVISLGHDLISDWLGNVLFYWVSLVVANLIMILIDVPLRVRLVVCLLLNGE